MRESCQRVRAINTSESVSLRRKGLPGFTFLLLFPEAQHLPRTRGVWRKKRGTDCTAFRAVRGRRGLQVPRGQGGGRTSM